MSDKLEITMKAEASIVKIEPGDRLVIKLPPDLPTRAVQEVDRYMRYWAGQEVPIVILHSGVEMEVVRREGERTGIVHVIPESLYEIADATGISRTEIAYLFHTCFNGDTASASGVRRIANQGIPIFAALGRCLGVRDEMVVDLLRDHSVRAEKIFEALDWIAARKSALLISPESRHDAVSLGALPFGESIPFNGKASIADPGAKWDENDSWRDKPPLL
jgi:hypothetical protein